MTYHTSDDDPSSSSSRSSRRGSCGEGSRTRSRTRNRRRSHGARKERVLHTRVSEQLSEDIRRFAEDLRVPASNLVRNVLEEVFTVVDGMTDDVGDLFDDLLDEAEGVRERVRNQTRARPRRHSRRSSKAADEDIEAEFREDEASEAPPSAAASRDDSTAKKPGEDSGVPEPEIPTANELFPDVLGWQPLVLNRDFECGRCTRALGAGESAFLGLSSSGLTEIALCGRCAGRR